MDRYSAVTEYRFDWRTEREPSCDDIVFWRETGTKDDDDDVDALEGACSIETAISKYGRWLRTRPVKGAWACVMVRFHGPWWVGDFFVAIQVRV